MTHETTSQTHDPHAGGRQAADPPSPKPRLTICPYCGSRCRGFGACEHCRGKFDPLSRQATQNAMGPWFIRDESNPHRPGCSYDTLVRMVARGKITGDTVLRGPGSRQFWTLARWCPGVGHLLGVCHSCQRRADPQAAACEACGASFVVPDERQVLGLGEVRALPGQAAPSQRDRAAPEPPAALSSPEPLPDPSMTRVQRELRKARRWRAVWFVAFCTLVALGAGAALVRVLDLDAGPVGRWLGGAPVTVPAREGEPVTPIVAPRLSPEPLPGSGSAGEPEPRDEAEPVSPEEPRPEPAGAEAPTAPEAVSAADPELAARLASLAEFRGLR